MLDTKEALEKNVLKKTWHFIKKNVIHQIIYLIQPISCRYDIIFTYITLWPMENNINCRKKEKNNDGKGEVRRTRRFISNHFIALQCCAVVIIR